MSASVGYAGRDERAQDVILDGLRRLEHRGYDAAALAIVGDGKLRVARSRGKLVNLDASLRDVPLRGSVGLGHTDWAARGSGEPSGQPHRARSLAVLVSGVVESDEEGAASDEELAARLIHMERARGSDLAGAVRAALAWLPGSYVLLAVDEQEPDCLVAARAGGVPLWIGTGDGESFAASDLSSILPYTRNVLALQDGEVARLARGGVEIRAAGGARVERAPLEIAWDPVHAEKAGYERFMLKEIFEQPRALGQLVGSALRQWGALDLDGIALDPAWVRELRGVQLTGCGTAAYAGLVGRHLLEGTARVPAVLEVASELRDRAPLLDRAHLVVGISQSGETADTIGALHEARGLGARCLAITNAPDSALARSAADVLRTRAGPEIAIASTKGFTAQVTALWLLALELGRLRGALADDALAAARSDLRRLPRLVAEALTLWDGASEVAQRVAEARGVLFLGCGTGHALALEGALKLEETSYLHAQGLAAGEVRHGPLALIDTGTPVVIVANQRASRARLLANAGTVRERGACVIAVAERGDAELERCADFVLRVPAAPEPLSAVLAAVPLQLLAYHVARLRGSDVDQPRHLAKSVRVD